MKQRAYPLPVREGEVTSLDVVAVIERKVDAQQVVRVAACLGGEDPPTFEAASKEKVPM